VLALPPHAHLTSSGKSRLGYEATIPRPSRMILTQCDAMRLLDIRQRGWPMTLRSPTGFGRPQRREEVSTLPVDLRPRYGGPKAAQHAANTRGWAAAISE